MINILPLILTDEHPHHYMDITTYPDGQRNIKLNFDYLNDVKIPIEIKCRIKTFADFELLLALVAALRKNDFVIDEITFMYCMGMRCDRAFESGMPNYFRDVIAPIINGLKIPTTHFHIPHGTLAMYYIDNYRFVSPSQLHEFWLPNHIMIAGDESAAKMFIGGTHYFNKKRMQNGEIEIYMQKDALTKIKTDIYSPITIFDDLCDGGATFIAEAKYLREQGINNPLYLVIAHGLFSKGFEELLTHFEKIYFTNSYCNFNIDPSLQTRLIQKDIFI
jgi:ribose-phosphate pyrophosphokinase